MPMREHRRQEVAQRAGSEESQVAAMDPMKMLAANAERFNRKHTDDVVSFNKATKGKVGSGDKVSVQKVMAWQREHGLTPDGKVGKETLAAAEAQVDVPFAEDEAEAVTGHETHVEVSDAPSGAMDEEPSDEHDATLAEHTAGAGAEDAPRMPEEEEGEATEAGGTAVSEGFAKSAEGSEFVEELGAKGTAGTKVLAGLAVLPHVVSCLQRHKYSEAVQTIVGMVGLEERAELLEMAVKKAGIHSEVLHALLKKAVVAGAVADVLMLGWEFTAGSFKAMAHAKERGEAESLLGIYAYAWSQTIIEGHHSNPGAITEEQREAMTHGIEEGEATSRAQPELAFLLIEEYGSEDNARHALEDALYQREGIDVQTHVGR